MIDAIMLSATTRRLLIWMLPILGLGALLRLIGIGHGLPFAMMGGEDVLIGAGLRMAETGELLPSLGERVAAMLDGPVLLPWLYLLLALPVLGLAWLWNGFPGGVGIDWMVLANLDSVFVVARLTSIAFSLATVVLVALVARRLFGDRLAGIAAGLLMATSWLSVALAHSADRWSALTFFVWLTIYIATRYASRPGPRRAMLLGLAAGLGFGTGILGGVGLLAGLAVHLSRYRRKALNRNLAWMLAPAVLLGALFAAAHWPEQGGAGDVLATAGRFIAVAWWAEPVLLAGGLLSLALLLRRHARLVGLLLAGAALWIVLAALIGLDEDRALLPLLPLLALAAGGGVLWLAEHLPLRLIWPGAVAGALALLYPLVTAGWFSLLLASSDTRELAATWLDDNLAPGSAVVIDLDPVTVPATLDGLLDQELYLPDSLDTRMRLALETGWPESTPPGLRALHVNRAAPDAVEGDAGRALFAELHAAGYSVFAIALRDDATPSGLQRAVLADYDRLALFLTSDADAAPHAPDLTTSALVDGPVWRLFRLERLGRSVLIARVGGD